MPNPTKGDVHVNKPLSNISIAYIQDQKKFVASQVFPNVPVEKQSDLYFTYDKGDWLRDEAQERAASAESAGSGWDLDTTGNYFSKVFAHHKDIDDQVATNQDDPINMDRDATTFVTQKLLLKREKQWLASYFKTSVWGSDFTPSTLWSASGSDPMNDVDTQSDAIEARTGFRPNVMVVGPSVFTKLKANAAVLDRIKYTQRGQVTEDLLASLFGVDKFLVARAVENTAKKGAAFAGSYLYGKHALLVYANPSPSILMPSGGYTFSWKGYLGAGAEGNRIKKFRMEHLNSDRVEGEMAFDMKLIAADVGVFFNGAIA